MQLPPRPELYDTSLDLDGSLKRLVTSNGKFAAISEDQIRPSAGSSRHIVASCPVKVPFVDRHHDRVRQVGFLPRPRELKIEGERNSSPSWIIVQPPIILPPLKSLNILD
jgi:hypothetical protein